MSSEEPAELRKLRAEERELRRANEILEAASSLFAAELDRVPPEYSIGRLTCRYWLQTWRWAGWLAGCL